MVNVEEFRVVVWRINEDSGEGRTLLEVSNVVPFEFARMVVERLTATPRFGICCEVVADSDEWAANYEASKQMKIVVGSPAEVAAKLKESTCTCPSCSMARQFVKQAEANELRPQPPRNRQRGWLQRGLRAALAWFVRLLRPRLA